MSKLSKKIVHDKLHMKYLVAVKTKSGSRIYSFDDEKSRQQYIKDLNSVGYEYATANKSDIKPSKRRGQYINAGLKSKKGQYIDQR